MEGEGASGPATRNRFDVIIHAGQHKTGTTSIQRFMLEKREEFLRRGVYIPRTGQAWTGSHHMVAAALGGERSIGFTLADLGREMAAAGVERVLLSAEHAKKEIVEGRGDRMVDTLRSLGARKVHILLYVRSPFALANAIYAQWTAALALQGASFEQFLVKLREQPYFDYQRFVDLAERDDVTLTARPYDNAARQGSVNDFLAQLGLSWQVEQEARLNTSIGPIALEALRAFARTLPAMSSADRHALIHWVYQIGRSLPERSYWRIDECVERELGYADRQTDAFSLKFWGKTWRAAIGEERRALNLFDLKTARPSERNAYEQILRQLQEAGAQFERERQARSKRPRHSL